MEGLPYVAAADRHCWLTRWAGELEIGEQESIHRAVAEVLLPDLEYS